MFDTLRGRFILSHLLPLLIIIPLMGIALVYVVETQVLVPNIVQQLSAQAVLFAEIASDHPEIWNDPHQAEQFLVRISPRSSGRVMLLSNLGRVWASTDAADAPRLGQVLDNAALSGALAGSMETRQEFSADFQAQVVDVFVPVLDRSSGTVIGVVRVTNRLATVLDQFLSLRAVIIGVLAVALALGLSLALALALNLERPLEQLTHAVNELASGAKLEPLPERGVREVRVLLRAFNVLTQRLRAVEESRTQLVANLVHELGTTLGALNSGLQALRGGADEQVELRHELLKGMDDEVKQLRRLTDDLTQLSTQLTGTFRLQPRPIELSEWLRPALAPWREAAEAKGLDFQMQISEDLPVLEIDPERLAQVLSNLLRNAIKYTPPSGSIAVNAWHDAQQVWIRVADSGVGIPQEEQTQIFDPFYRGRFAGRFPKGMGLGLTIARDLVRAHDGQLDVSSAPGKGSQFTIRLPVNKSKL
jgi:two-component system sensor histidine kinase BaeS